MTNEELDKARVDEAFRVVKADAKKNFSLEIARLAREGWTPPKPVNPDLAEAEKLANEYAECDDWPFLANWFLKAIKRGRELEREAKPGMVWVKHDGKGQWPVQSHKYVCVRYESGAFIADRAASICWPAITHYAIITQPDDAA